MNSIRPDPDVPLAPARVLQLLQAYGADTARWPDAEREAAHLLPRQQDETLRTARQEAGALDALLRSHAPALPGPALMARIAALAPARPRPRLRWPAWAGIGLAGATAGALAATLLLQAAPAPAREGWNEAPDVFGAARAEWSEE